MKEAITAVRMLAAQSIQKANSGHPGLAIGSAPTACVLFDEMKHVPGNPNWQNRDRFVLSAGHASALLYSLLHFYGYGISMEDMQQFRQLGSITPGHPEYGIVPGVEATTGPLGQGFAMAVGMAMAEAHMASVYNKPGFPIVDNYTYTLMGDGCIMEGISSEAASLAGHLKLGKLIAVYDSNRITIEGATDVAFDDDTHKRFEAYGWQVLEVADGEDTEAIRNAIRLAKAETEKPSLIIVHTIIGYGTPRAGSPKAHGEPLGEENVKAMAEFFHWNEEPFSAPASVYEYFSASAKKGIAAEQEWNALFEAYKKEFPEDAAAFEKALSGDIPELETDDYWDFSDSEASRSSSGTVLNRIAKVMPNLIGGSADLAPSNKTNMKGIPDFQPGCYEGRNIHFGVRELAMAAACNGMALYGGLHPFCATFFVFSDYVKPALRLSAIMKLPVLYILTHDSIGVGEDGPTHQPIEQLTMLRSVPGVNVFRPADGRECAAGYLSAFSEGVPSVMVLSRQNLPKLPNSGKEALKGAYIVKDTVGTPDVLLMGAGSEVELAMKAADVLAEEGISARVISFPSFYLFEKQPQEYKDHILPKSVRARVAVEAGATLSWGRYTGIDGEVVGLDTFGASGPYSKVFPAMGFTADAVVKAAKKSLDSLK